MDPKSRNLNYTLIFVTHLTLNHTLLATVLTAHHNWPIVALLSMLHIHHLGLNVKDNGSDQVEHHHPITSH